jgi:hypothetical protein
MNCLPAFRILNPNFRKNGDRKVPTKSRFRARRLCFIGLSVMLAWAQASAQKKEKSPVPDKAAILLTAGDAARVEKDSFTCADHVHAYVTLPDSFAGRHKLEGRWFRPDGIAQERTQFEVEFSTGGPRIAYLWLGFGGKDKSVFDEFSLGGDYGEDRHDFTGDWTLQLHVDGKFLTQKSFQVTCN